MKLEKFARLEKEIDKLKEKLNLLTNGKDFMKLLINLIKQQQKMSKVLEQVSGRKFDVVLPSKLDEDRLICSSVKNLVKNTR